MQWFKHEVNAQDDIKLKKLKQQYGLKGIGMWWCLVERVAKEGLGGYLELEKYTKEDMISDWKIDIGELNDILKYMGELELIDNPCLETAIFIPALAERADDYTKRIERELTSLNTDRRRTRAEAILKNQAPTSELVRYFRDKHKEYIEIGYSPVWGRDTAIMKDLLEDYSKDEVKMIINEFIKAALEPEIWWADKVSVPTLKSCAHNVIGRLRKNEIISKTD